MNKYDTVYQVVVEWDASHNPKLNKKGQPPTTYYNRLEALGVSIRRGSSDPDPLSRRAIQDGRLAIQESVYTFSQIDTAREVCMLALELGAKEVHLQRVERIEFHVTTEDVKVYERIESIAGRRGRRSAEDVNRDWDVVCLNEDYVYIKADARYVLNCPHCGGMKVKAFPVGKIKRYQMPDDNPNENMVTRWARAAFANGEFVPVAVNGEIPPATPRTPHGIEGTACDNIMRSEELQDEKIGHLSGWVAANILDAIFIARTAIADDIRMNTRSWTCVGLMEGKADPIKIKVAEDPTQFDVLDAASVIGIDQTIGFWNSIYSRQ